jgi:UPF0716 family protein affecting phage T7 exclusion
MLYFIRRTNLVEWIALAAATFLLYWPGYLTDATGLLLVGGVYLMQKARNRRDLAATT